MKGGHDSIIQCVSVSYCNQCARIENPHTAADQFCEGSTEFNSCKGLERRLHRSLCYLMRTEALQDWVSIHLTKSSSVDSIETRDVTQGKSLDVLIDLNLQAESQGK